MKKFSQSIFDEVKVKKMQKKKPAITRLFRLYDFFPIRLQFSPVTFLIESTDLLKSGFLHSLSPPLVHHG